MKHSTTSSSFPRLSASLASPTPPDTESESEYEEDSETLVGRTHDDVAKPVIALWRPISSEVVVAAAATAAPSLWTPVPKTGATEMAPGEIPEGSIRRAVRKDLEPLTIASSRLWEKPASKHPVVHRGLWRAASGPSQDKTQVVEVGVQQSAPRKPPRRIRRVTLLPDILESPKPFDKRGTLGIFQFPWGEQSDSATVAPRALTLMAMPGTMASRGDSGLINAGVIGGVQSDEESSSSSFMDDYEREDDDGEYYDDESSDYETYDSDAEEDDEDGVDETTMWEIVGLLEPSQRKISSEGEPHHQGECAAVGLRSETQKEERATYAEASQGSAKFSDDNKASSNSKAAVMSLPSTNISSSHADSSPPRVGPAASATDSQISQTQGPHPRMTPTDMDLRGRLHGKVEQVREGEGEQGQRQASQGLTKIDAHLIASSAADAAIGGAAPRPEPPVASISSVPSPSISNAPVPHPWSRAPMNDAVATHETALPQLLPNRTPASSSPLTWTSSPVEVPPSQHIRNQGAAHPVAPVSWRVSADLSAAESAPVNSAARHIQIRGASANLNSDSLLSSFPLPPQHSPRHQNLHWNLDATPSIQPMALWSSPSPPVLRPSQGLAQPDAATWNAYLPTDDIARVLPAKAELPAIESNSLWTPPPKKVEEPSHHGLWGTKSTTLPGMWAQPPVLEKVSYGLPQPDPETWATYLVVMDDVPRVKPREAEPAFVESFSLWTAPKPVIPEDPSEDGLWSGSSASSSVSSISDSEPSTPREAANFGLWEPAPANAVDADDEEPTGLFSLTHRRTEFRTTKLSPAALDMARSPRKPLEPYPDFGFTHLWNMAPLWDAKATAAAVKLQRELDELVLEGLFSLNHRRNNFRTTSEPPAALETRPKLRISQDPLPKLSSDSLWSVRAPAEAPVELDWIALSTVRQRTSSVASSTDNESFVSARSTTTTAASSVKSEACSTTLPRTAARRFDATPAQWLAALDEATRASELDLYVRRSSPETDKDAPTLDLAADSDPCSPDSSSQSNYQLWSKPDSDDSESPSVELWKPSSSPPTNPRFLELTPALRDYDKQHASSGTSHRGRALEKSRPPPPIMHGSTSSAFLPAVSSETPRDFSAQALWARAQSPAGGPPREDENTWLDKSLRKSLSFVQLW
ncbi:hypothetical protein ACJ41O_008540 [Fusarium nematophilum]